MSQINVNTITGKDGGSAVNFPNGITVTGVVTATTLNQNVVGVVSATTFDGNVTGNADTATVATNAQGLSGTPNITVGTVGCGNVTSSGNISATDATFSGNLTVQGTTTTIDTAVTAVDSLAVDGNVDVGAGLSAYGYKIEQGRSDTTSNIGATHNYDLGTGHIQRFSAASGSNYSPNFRIDASTTLNSKMNVGDVIAATLIVASSSHYCLNTLQVDGTQVGVTTSWIGGSAPSAANGSGFDIYAFTIMKTASTPTYHIIANATSAA
jgi:hypothetical protein